MSTDFSSESAPSAATHAFSQKAFGSVRVRQGLMIFGASLGLFAGFAPLYFGTISIFLGPISEEFGWGRAQTSGVGVLSMLGLAFGSLVVGRCIDVFGEIKVIGLSVVVMAFLVATQSQVGNSPITFATLSLCIGFAGAGTTPPGYVSVLAKSLKNRLGLALGLVGVGMGLGTVTMPLLAEAFISRFGWRDAYLYLAIIAAVLGTLACILLNASRGENSSGESIGVATARSVNTSEFFRAIGDFRYWLLIGVALLVSVSTLGMSVHFVSLMTDAGVSKGYAARGVALSGIGVVCGRLLSGYLIDIVEARLVAAVSFLIAGVGAVQMSGVLDVPLFYFAVAGIFLGFALGAEGDFLPFLVKRYFGKSSFGVLYGILFFVHAIGGVIGPICFGLSFDMFGSYKYALLCAAGLLCIASVFVFWLGKESSGASH
ncbi:MFS transporter [Cupriavidus basilensis]